ncbi:MAG: sugar phosphate isomerase/epimerase family protein [Mycobacteriaceae bacterium]|uniref:sugar phosphate isomerase/epimerase family protein n=1 Tax=Corynebacterium sp. TaxID=1720 RepID=UPI003F99F613
MTTDPQLLATCWISAGDAAPARGDERSPVPIEDRISLIADTGWSGIGLLHADLVAARDTIGYPALSRLIRDAGIDTVEVEFLEGWWTTGQERVEAEAKKEVLFEAAKALDARHIKVGAGFREGSIPLDTMARAYSDLAVEAEGEGLRLALEATPFSYLENTQNAIEVVSRADSPSAGLLVDIFHTAKNGIPNDEVWRMVPMERVAAVEIDDGFFETKGGYFLDGINNRAYPGEAEFDTRTFVEGALKAGWDGPWGVEVISEAHRQLPVREGLEKARDTALNCFPK